MVLPDCSTYHPSQRGAGGHVAAVLAAGPAYPDAGTRELQEEAHAAYLYKQSRLAIRFIFIKRYNYSLLCYLHN